MARAHRRPSRERRTYLIKNPARCGAGNPLRRTRSLAVSAMAWTGVSVLGPAHAITLGEITVHSTLGQPLDATVPVQLATGEYLGATCVSAPRGQSAELGAVKQARIQAPETSTPGLYDIRVTTLRPLYEPMYELQLQVKCPGTALLVRQYVLMLDLPGTLPELAAAPTVVQLPAVPAASGVAEAPGPAPDAPRPVRARRLAPAGAPIEAGSRYRVGEGDTLSTISARVRDRGGAGVWPFADRIFAANPTAFMGGNPDLIKLGSEIDIPLAAPGSPVPAAASVNVAATPTPTLTLPVAPPQASDPAPMGAVAAEAAPAGSVEAVTAIPAAETVTPVEPAAPVVATATSEPQAQRARDATRRPDDSSNSPLLAAGLGILVGLGLSLALLRARLIGAFRDYQARRAARGTPVMAARPAAVAPPPPAPAARFQRTVAPREPSMVVEEAPAETTQNIAIREPTARTPALPIEHETDQSTGSRDLDADLASLFADDRAVSLPEALETDVPPYEADAGLDLDLTGAATDGDTAERPGWTGSDTRLAPTQKAAVPAPTGDDTAEQLDLQALASSAEGDEKLSQTLMEALTLLERDYEDELTASQVVDLNKLRESGADDDDTVARTGTGSRKLR